MKRQPEESGWRDRFGDGSGGGRRSSHNGGTAQFGQEQHQDCADEHGCGHGAEPVLEVTGRRDQPSVIGAM